MRLLLVEDDQSFAHFLLQQLQKAFCVDWASNLSEAEHFLLVEEYKSVLLELCFTEGFCWQYFSSKTQSCSLPQFVFLATRQQYRDFFPHVCPFPSDFLFKPFSLFDLRKKLANGQGLFDQKKASPLLTQQQFTRKEFLLLETFLQHSGKILTEAFLIQQAWQNEQECLSNTFEAQLCRLRKKIAPLEIKTWRGCGYSLDVPLSFTSAASLRSKS